MSKILLIAAAEKYKYASNADNLGNTVVRNSLEALAKHASAAVKYLIIKQINSSISFIETFCPALSGSRQHEERCENNSLAATTVCWYLYYFVTVKTRRACIRVEKLG